jgi:hypothetical protein
MHASIGVPAPHLSLVYADAGYRIEAKKRETVPVSMVVGTFQKDAAREYIPEFEVQAHRGDGISQDLFLENVEIVLFHFYEFYFSQPHLTHKAHRDRQALYMFNSGNGAAFSRISGVILPPPPEFVCH